MSEDKIMQDILMILMMTVFFCVCFYFVRRIGIDDDHSGKELEFHSETTCDTMPKAEINDNEE